MASHTQRQTILNGASAKPRFAATALTVAILLLAAALRFHDLGVQSLWNDEGNSYVQATRTFSDIAAHAGRDIHPPGYYWALAAWRGPAGETEFALRALSAFASLLAVAFSAALGRRLYGASAAAAAALFATLNTFSIFYAQETRMYSPLALWSVAAMWALAGFLRRPGRKWALALAVFNLAGLWTQYVYPLVMLAQGLVLLAWLLPRRRIDPPLKWYIAANLLTLALYLPWLPTALRQVRAWPNTGQPIAAGEVFNVLLGWLAFGSTYAAHNFAAVGYAPVIVFLVVGVLPFRRGVKSYAPTEANPNDLWRTLLPAAWVLLMVGVFLALGLFRFANLKLLLPAQLGFALWLGRGVWLLWRGAAGRGCPATVRRLLTLAGVVGLAAGQAAGLDPLYNDPAFQRADYRAIVADIRAELRPGDAIILNAPNQEEVFRYYYDASAPIFPLPTGLGGDDGATRAAVRDIIARYERVFAVFWGEAERDPQRVVEGTLDSEAFEVGSRWYGDVRLARYALPDEPQIAREVNARFGEHIFLDRYLLSGSIFGAGDVLQLQLEWRIIAALNTRYKVTVQLLDENGALAAQRDSEPGGGRALTTTWTPGEAIVDRHGLPLPPDLAPGDYRLTVALYDSDDPSARLPVGDGDFVELEVIAVE